VCRSDPIEVHPTFGILPPAISHPRQTRGIDEAIEILL
jgi:hypothetical protein